jgi:hypothetical protein
MSSSISLCDSSTPINLTDYTCVYNDTKTYNAAAITLSINMLLYDYAVGDYFVIMFQDGNANNFASIASMIKIYVNQI